jgi:hypothetical protein
MTSKAERPGQNHGQVRARPGAVRRPNSAPPYYLGYPARLWIAAITPYRGADAARAQ